MQASEILISLPAVIPSVTAIRSTLVQSSLNTLRRRGHFDRYLTLIEPKYKSTLLESMAPEWLPLELAMAHYAACENLNLAQDELIQLGEDVGERIQGAFIGTLVRQARTIGLTPWVVLGHFQKLWARLMQGGAVGLTRTGPKDATVELRSLELCKFGYFRAALCGVITSGIKLGSGRGTTVRVAGLGAAQERCILRCSWV